MKADTKKDTVLKEGRRILHCLSSNYFRLSMEDKKKV